MLSCSVISEKSNISFSFQPMLWQQHIKDCTSWLLSIRNISQQKLTHRTYRSIRYQRLQVICSTQSPSSRISVLLFFFAKAFVLVLEVYLCKGKDCCFCWFTPLDPMCLVRPLQIDHRHGVYSSSGGRNRLVLIVIFVLSTCTDGLDSTHEDSITRNGVKDTTAISKRDICCFFFIEVVMPILSILFNTRALDFFPTYSAI